MSDGFEEYVKLKMLGKDTDEVNFKVGVWTKMDTLKKLFSSCQAIPVQMLRFEFNGRRINGDITPWNLDLKDGDVIDVFVERPHAQSAEESLFIRLTGLCGERCLRVKQTAAIGKIIKYFSDWKNAPESALKFVFNETRINYEDTPWRLKMKDNDTIAVAYETINEEIESSDQNHVVIKLFGNDPDVFGLNGKHFKIKQTTNMGRLFDYYNEKYNIPESLLKLFFNGSRVHYNDTPETLGIKNGDIVQACLEVGQMKREASFIKIKAVYCDDTLLRFKVRPRTKFRKLKKHYSEFVGVPVDYLRFLFFETTISDDDTPEKLKMKNEVVIEVVRDRASAER